MFQLVLFSIVICLSVKTESVIGSYAHPNIIEANVVHDRFPDDFLLGSATSAFQAEGGWNEDGRGPSIWDDFVHQYPDKIAGGENHDIASYSYRYYEDDIKALKDLGATAYRLSISWSRVLPTGDVTNINEKGIAYYDNLLNKLVENGIEPVVTLCHYDLPSDLQKFGGYTNYVFVKYFEAYAKLMFEKFGDRVKYWITFNEPYHACTEGCGRGHRAPLINADGIGEYMCMHNKLKAHALAYHVYRKHFYEKQKGKIGIAISARFAYSATNDTAAVDRALQFQIGWTAHAIFTKKGDYPEVMRAQIDLNSLKEGRPWSRLPTLSTHWKNKIRGSADFLALNYYTSRFVEMKEEPTGPNPSWERDAMFREVIPKEWKKGRTRWLYSVPHGLRDFLKWIRNEYNDVEVMITENGWSDEGEIEDHDRIEYLRDHMAEVLKVLKNKESNLTGYLVWALIDNFEWAGAFTERFGLYAVNFTSPRRERTPKLSAKFVKKVFESRQLPPT